MDMVVINGVRYRRNEAELLGLIVTREVEVVGKQAEARPNRARRAQNKARADVGDKASEE